MIYIPLLPPLTLSTFELRTRWVLLGLFVFYSPLLKNNTDKTKQKTKHHSIEWRSRFTASQGQGSSGWMLSWSGLFFLSSFLSLRCPLGSHPSPSIPLFSLFYINTIRLGSSPHWNTLSLSLSLSFPHTHVREHTNGPHAHRFKWGCWQSATVKRPSFSVIQTYTVWHTVISSPPEGKLYVI